MALGLRYASALVNACHHQSFGNSTWQGGQRMATAAGGLQDAGSDLDRLYVSPGAYSAVRKVVFWASVRQEHTGTPLANVPIRLRVAPSSSDSNSRVIESRPFASGSISRTLGTGAVWSNLVRNNESCYYPASLAQNNQIHVARFNTINSGGAQLVFQEFERFAANSDDFFNDWDSIVAMGDDTQHIAYTLACERGDGNQWSASGTGSQNNRPIIVACGFAVVQAPTGVNNTRVYVPATKALYGGAIIAPSFGSLSMNPFFYRESDWDGELEVRWVSRQLNTVTQNGNFSIEVADTVQDTTTRTVRYTEGFNSQAASVAFLARSEDFLSSIQDGDALTGQYRSDTGGNQARPWGWWEITHRDFNRHRSYFMVGGQPVNISLSPGGAPPPDTWFTSECLFNPAWFQAIPDENILDRIVEGALHHVADTNDTELIINLNADLAADVTSSVFNVIMAPQVSSTPDATLGYKFQQGEILNNDPIDLAGMRKMTLRMGGSSWLGGSDDVPGGIGVSYLLNVPNTEFLDAGPLFELGAFNPEGCAATSAGLGDPGVLVITNGSVRPKKFNPRAAGTAAEIEDAGIPPPFEGEEPSSLVTDAANSPDGGLGLGTYRYRYTFRNCCTNRESDPNLDDIVVDTSGASPAARVTLSFAGVRIPADAQICEICVYRTTLDGDFPVMAKVGCFDPDTTSTFIDDVDDDALDFLNNGLSIINAPMPCVPIVVDYRNRLFGMGDIPNLAPAGRVSVVNGSDIVEGSSDVEWDICLVGKFIQLEGDCRPYEILRVMPPEAGVSPAIGRLKLVDFYEGETDNFVRYTICGRPNRLYFSEPLEPEYWPAPNFLDVEPGDGDRLMGAASNYDRLVICKRNKTYVLTFRENPGFEVLVPSRISSDIGCIAPRSFAQVESGTAWLSDRGIALFDGRSVQHVPESDAMNDIFINPNNPNYVRRDRNGRVIEAVGVFYPKREQYLLLLPTIKTSRGSSLMCVWDVKLRNITLLEFCQEFQSMVVGKDADGNQRVYLGDVNGFVWIYDVGDTDGVGLPNSTGTVRGTVTFAGPDSGVAVLDDSSASFITGGVPGLANLSGIAGLSGALEGSDMGLAGACVFVREANAPLGTPWRSRTIYAATPTRLFVTPPWGSEAPAPGDDYMIGPIEWKCVFKPNNYGTDDVQKRNWSQIMVHRVEDFASKVRVELRPDFQLSDPQELSVVDPQTQETGKGRNFLMDYSKGRQVAPVGREVHNFEQVILSNFAPEEPIGIINYLLRVTPRASK